jgi:hypothetical protein
MERCRLSNEFSLLALPLNFKALWQYWQHATPSHLLLASCSADLTEFVISSLALATGHPSFRHFNEMPVTS